jgi:8-oxo-dGTP pyrophosphatase MutT (NUDIX family)
MESSERSTEFAKLRYNWGCFVIVPDPDMPRFALMVEETKGVSKGKMGFPGGGKDIEDVSIIATGIRETLEETGLDVVEVSGVGVYRTKKGPRALIVATHVLGSLITTPEHPVSDYMCLSEIEFMAGKDQGRIRRPDMVLDGMRRWQSGQVFNPAVIEDIYTASLSNDYDIWTGLDPSLPSVEVSSLALAGVNI